MAVTKVRGAVWAAGCCAIWIGAVLTAHAAGNADPLRALLEAKQPQAAFDAGLANDGSLGDPEFDFYFGIAALETDHAAEAILALERYTLRFPDNTLARFQLARAYFAAGEDDAAKAEFTAIRDRVPKEAAELARQFLAAIEARDAQRKPQWQGFVELGLGYDSNITTGIAGGIQPVVPGFGTLPIQPDLSTGVAASDRFATASIGFSGVIPRDPYSRWLLNVGADTRRMGQSENSMFDQQNVRLDGGFALDDGPLAYRANLGVSQAWLDQQRYVMTPSVSGEVMYAYAPQSLVGLNLQWAKPTYSDSCSYFLRDRSSACVDNQASQRNARVTGLGLGWQRKDAGRWSPQWSLAATVAREDNLSDIGSLTRRIDGLRGTLALQLAAEHGVSIGLNWQRSRYQDIYPVADVARSDRQLGCEIGWQYRASEQWLLRVDASTTRQESNIGLYDYRRDVVSVTARRTFK